jgi:hypothetical protein
MKSSRPRAEPRAGIDPTTARHLDINYKKDGGGGLGGSHLQVEEEEPEPLLLAPGNVQKFLFPTSDLETEREPGASARLSGNDELRDQLARMQEESQEGIAVGVRWSCVTLRRAAS